MCSFPVWLRHYLEEKNATKKNLVCLNKIILF